MQTGNTTMFTSIHLSSSMQNLGIWGAASTGTCSVLFGLTPDGYTMLRSIEIAGDIHSLAWSPSGHNLHALDSHSSQTSFTSVTNFRISDNPTLEDIIGTDVLANVTSGSQVTTHPTGSYLYVVTQYTNELVVVPLHDDTFANASLSTSRHQLIPATLDNARFHTSAVAVTSSKDTMWTLSQSSDQAIVTVFSINRNTGAIGGAIARASWTGAGDGQLAAAPFERGNMIAITNSPMGYVTVLGLESGFSYIGSNVSSEIAHDFLQPLETQRQVRGAWHSSHVRIKSYGRVLLDDYVSLGESVWID